MMARRVNWKNAGTRLLLMAGMAGLTACGGMPESKAEFPQTRREIERERTGTISGNKDGFVLFGGNRRNQPMGSGRAAESAGIGVNAYLWKASLDTISFMPLASADPFGGVILTDWYTPAETPNERLKVNILIKDKQLRSDGVKVSLFKQQLRGSGWVDLPADAKAARSLENAILTRARQLKMAQG